MKTYEGHSHYVMGLAINPKDPNTFASACLDRTVKVWSIGSERPNYTIEAHETKGVNHVDYYPHADNPYLLTTSDDQTVKIWDYTSKNLVHTLGDHAGEGHTSNVSFACYHPVLPIIISGSEDGTVKLWSSITFKLLDTIKYNLERAWCVSYQREKQGIAMGFDDGAVVVKIGRDDPAVSMQQQGWFAWYSKTDISIARFRKDVTPDGEPISLEVVKSEDFNGFYPQSVLHNRQGTYIAVCGSTEYAIYNSRKMEPLARGFGGDFAWGINTKTNNFAVCIRSGGREKDFVKVMTNQVSGGASSDKKPAEQEIPLPDDETRVQGLTGGTLLGIRTQDSLYFMDWDTGTKVHKMAGVVKQVWARRCTSGGFH